MQTGSEGGIVFTGRPIGGFLCAVFVLILVVLLSSSSWADMNLKEGKWETLMEMTMEGVPMKLAPTRGRQCITRDDAVPKGSEKQKHCTISDQAADGDTVRWRVRCVEKAFTNEGDGQIVYNGETYRGKMMMIMTDRKGAKRNLAIVMSGKRIGDCGPGEGRRQKEADISDPVFFDVPGPGSEPCLVSEFLCMREQDRPSPNERRRGMAGGNEETTGVMAYPED